MKNEKKESYKTMPHSIEAEQSVLGSILIDNEAAINIMALLNGDDFYSPMNKIIYKKMTEIYRENKPIDFVTLTDSLEKTGELDSVGGIDYIITLTNAVPSAVRYKHYADIVKRDSLLRSLIIGGQKIIENAYNSVSGEDSLKFAERQVFDISEKQDVSSLEHIDSAIKEVLEKLNKIAKDPSSLQGLKTGFDDLDYLTNGLQKSDLILLAARPGFGKTSLAMNIINYVAIEGRKNCAVFSLEMPKVQIAQRSICSIAGINMSKALKGKLSVEEWAAAIKASKKLSEANIFIDDSSISKPMDILSKCRRLKREKGLDIVMVDYLQLMNPDNSKIKGERYLEIADITRTLKIAARELNIPIILLSQLSRAADKRQGEPKLSDLRDSGAIEQDADIVVFIHKSDMYNNDVDNNGEMEVVDIIVAKHRNGPTGKIELYWDGESTSFLNMKQQKNRHKTVVFSQNDEIATEKIDKEEIEEIKDLFMDDDS